MKIRKTVVRFVAIHDDGDEDAIVEALSLAGDALAKGGISCGMTVHSRVIDKDGRPEPETGPAPDKQAN